VPAVVEAGGEFDWGVRGEFSVFGWKLKVQELGSSRAQEFTAEIAEGRRGRGDAPAGLIVQDEKRN
jgi:hypothetical protein